ncbi:MAG: ribosomal L7Ae/L30e/S12e/Gadd45 family protein [Eubacterium sp.]|nr:ribosomal L7Ae/L30e/S12e/Gadd45 family protein [Eubacterium sp.]
MKNSKFRSYMGFAARSGNLQTGYNTALLLISKRKAKLLIVAEDVGENTRSKMIQKCISNNIKYRIFGKAEELSQITGNIDKGIFAIIDRGFAESICKEIDIIQSEKEVSNGNKSI